MIISIEDREKIRKFEKIMKRGLYANDAEVVDVLNRILDKRERPSNCGSCCRRHIQMVVDALNHQEELEAKQAQIKAAEALKNDELNNTPKEENNAPQEPQKRSGGRKKKQ